MPSPALQIGAIHIIESLPPGHLRTGERLFDALEPLVIARQPEISVHFRRVSTRAEFLQCLLEVATDVRVRCRAPLLQIETHGDVDGLELASGEHLRWADLKPLLTNINLLCRLNLLVILAACDGAELVHVIRPADRAPVWAVIGPSREVTAGEIEDAHQAFYREFLATRNGSLAWQAMNAAIERGDSPFRLFRAERMFREVMRVYFRQSCAEDNLSARVARIVAQAAAQGLTTTALSRFETDVSEYLRDHRRRFQENKEHFFFTDLCPGNSTRFPVTLEECLGTK